MAKAKQSGDGGGKTTNTNAKLEKQLRKATEAAKQLAQQPIVSELAVAALTAAAASLAANTKAGRATRRETAELASDAVKETSAIGSAVKQVLLDAARSLLDNLEQGSGSKRGRDDEERLAVAGPAEGGATKGGKKKRG